MPSSAVYGSSPASFPNVAWLVFWAVTTQGAILRYNLTGQITWALTDIGTGATLTGGTVSSFTGSAATTSTVAAQTADDNARRRLMQILATQIATKITATAGDWGAA